MLATCYYIMIEVKFLFNVDTMDFKILIMMNLQS